MHYVVYLDEFGHIGLFISRQDAKYNTSPIFGLGGLVLPVERVREFATWFYQLKCKLLAFEIQRDGIPAYRWEKKGSALYTPQNILKYRELRQATFRLLNKIRSESGMVLYVGLQKEIGIEQQDAKKLYRAVLAEIIKRMSQFCEQKQATFMVILDQQDGLDFRAQIVEEASLQMFAQGRTQMIEPPLQAESHLFQTLQCADWLCGLIGRVAAYKVLPKEYPELEPMEKFFDERLRQVSPRSGIRQVK